MRDNIFAPIFRDAPIAMIGIKEGKVVMANAEAIRFLGATSADELVGKRLEQVIPVDLRSRSSLLPALDRLAPGDIRSFERELALPGAVYTPVTIRATCLEGGMKLLCLLGNSEASDLKNSLFESEERRRGIMACLQVPVLGIDREYRIMWAGRKTAEKVGRKPHELVGRLCYRILRSRVKPCEGCPVAAASLGGGAVAGSVDNGSSRVSVVAAAVRGSGGYRSGSVVLCPDEGEGPAQSTADAAVSQLAPDYYMASSWQEALLIRLDERTRVKSWLAPRRGPGRTAALALQRQVPLAELFQPESRARIRQALSELQRSGDTTTVPSVELGEVGGTVTMIRYPDGVLLLMAFIPLASEEQIESLSLGDLARQAVRELEGALGKPVELFIENGGESELSGLRADSRLLDAFRRIGRTPPQGFGRKGLRMTLSRLELDHPMHDLTPGTYIGLHLSNDTERNPMEPPEDGHIRSIPLEMDPGGRLLVGAVSSAVHSYTVVLPDDMEEVAEE